MSLWDTDAIAIDIMDILKALFLGGVLVAFFTPIINILYYFLKVLFINHGWLSQQGFETMMILRYAWLAVPFIIIVGIFMYGILQALTKRSGGAY